jgi:hypothetical protein
MGTDAHAGQRFRVRDKRLRFAGENMTPPDFACEECEQTHSLRPQSGGWLWFHSNIGITPRFSAKGTVMKDGDERSKLNASPLEKLDQPTASLQLLQSVAPRSLGGVSEEKEIQA